MGRLRSILRLSVILFLFIDADCTKRVVKPSAPLPEPCCIITFDDGYQCVASAAYPLMRKHGFKGDCFVICDLIGHSQGGPEPKLNSQTAGSSYMSYADLIALNAAGWGIYNHSQDHRVLPDSASICSCYDTLVYHGFDANVFAYPFGAWNDTIAHIVALNHIAARTVDWGLQDHFSANQVYSLRAVYVSSGVSVERVKAMVDSCIDLNKVLILVYHDFCNRPGCSISHNIYVGDFGEVLDYLTYKNIKVTTFKQYVSR